MQHLCVAQALSARSALNPQIKGIEQIRGRTWGIFIYTIIPSWKPIGCAVVFCIYTEQTLLLLIGGLILDLGLDSFFVNSQHRIGERLYFTLFSPHISSKPYSVEKMLYFL